LRVNLNQPGIGGKVMIACAAPFPDPSRPNDPPLPIIRPIGTILDEETLEVHFSPDVKPSKWMPGDYRLLDSQIQPDQAQTLILYGTLLQPGADRVFRQTPTIVTLPTETEFTTKEQITWRFDADRVTAQVHMSVLVRRGPLFQLILTQPANYSFVKATSQREDLIAISSFSKESVKLEFSHPLLSDQTADFIFEFRGPPIAPTRFDFPAFSPGNLDDAEKLAGSDWNKTAHRYHCRIPL
jgi:hypothetical protein